MTTPALPRRADSALTLVRLVRLQNGVLAGLGVIAGAWWAAGWLRRSVFWAALAAGALAAVANIANDLADVEIDRVAHPERPLASGAMSVGVARSWLAIAIVAALAFATHAALPLGVITAVVIALMLAYNHGLKRAGLAGNVVVAILASLPFMYGAWAIDEAVAGVALVIVAAPLHFAREVAKDIDDAAGDAGRRRTLPLVYGMGVARWTGAGAAAIFCVAAATLAWHDGRLALALVPAVAVVIFAGVRLLRGQSGAPGLLKAAMALATVALIAVPR